eukprot:CAMPEP_0174853440 /NCGR_PEP_ID=MMETSP1114-20130205/28454_1 /TAXON_ID=312471 /ORGANISM="Neobodo designis, Strain CCAP 1951/1" /LENGTH=206 /DNA_ID=CAMNT_0016088087 /DNA_START=101 /DNA_END=721 /DNA_ORIENTATION=+
MVTVAVVRVKAPDAGAATTALEVERSERVTFKSDDARQDSVASLVAACIPEGMGASELELQNFEAALKRADAAREAEKKAAEAAEAEEGEGGPASPSKAKDQKQPPQYAAKVFVQPSEFFPLLPVLGTPSKPLAPAADVEAAIPASKAEDERLVAAVVCRYPVATVRTGMEFTPKNVPGAPARRRSDYYEDDDDDDDDTYDTYDDY